MKLPPKKLEELGSQGWVLPDDEPPAYARIAERRRRRGLPPPDEEESDVTPEPADQGEDDAKPARPKTQRSKP